MPIHSLTESFPRWITTTQNAPEPVILYQCSLARNLEGFNFPGRSSIEERRSIESRILNTLAVVFPDVEQSYYSSADMDTNMIRFLSERRVVPYEFLIEPGLRGVFVDQKQTLSVGVNVFDHLLFHAVSGDDTLQHLWESIDRLDSQLGKHLDYAYHERYGYLCSSLRLVGTGLNLSALLHLPAIVMTQEIPRIIELCRPRRLLFRGLSLGETKSAAPASTTAGKIPRTDVEPVLQQSLYLDAFSSFHTNLDETVGNLFLLNSQDTLGVSEGEMLFQIEQVIAAIIREEEKAREKLLSNQRERLLDHIGRALGIARSARLLGMGEALALASMIRLGTALGLASGYNQNALNRAILECQQAHLQILHEIPANPVALAAERARMFRALFSGTDLN
ncbi:MAG: hypothetical protein WCX86_12855 [Candidatus Hydrogenedentales bacterium]|jgi:protein arginine kinase